MSLQLSHDDSLQNVTYCCLLITLKLQMNLNDKQQIDLCRVIGRAHVQAVSFYKLK